MSNGLQTSTFASSTTTSSTSSTASTASTASGAVDPLWSVGDEEFALLLGEAPACALISGDLVVDKLLGLEVTTEPKLA